MGVESAIRANTGLNRQSVTNTYRADFRRNVRNRYRRKSNGGMGG